MSNSLDRIMYFVYTTAPDVPVQVAGVFRYYGDAERYAQKASGYRTIRFLNDWVGGELPAYHDTWEIES